MKKKLLVGFLTIIVCFILVGCGKSKDSEILSNKNDNNDSNIDIIENDIENKSIDEVDEQNDLNNNVNENLDSSEKHNNSSSNNNSSKNSVSNNKNKTESEENNQKDSNANGIYVVKFNLDGGTRYIVYTPKIAYVDTYSLTVKNGDTYGMATSNNQLPKATRPGYIFNGWYTEKNGTGTLITSNSMVDLKSNIEIYASWSEAITISYSYYDDNGNSFDNGRDLSIKKGTKLNELKLGNNITDALYTFDGYYINTNFNSKLDGEHVLQNGEKLYLRFIPNEYDATIESNGNGNVRLSKYKIKSNGSVVIYADANDGYEVLNIKYCVGQYCNSYGKNGPSETNSHGTYGWWKNVLTNYSQEIWYPGWEGGTFKIFVEFSKIN